MSKFTSALTAGLLAATGVVAIGAAYPAAADTPGCVSRAEFDQVTHGMSRARVHEIFDIDGKQISSVESNGHLMTIRKYLPCTHNSYVAVIYSDAHEIDKDAHWG
jgi:hypothetical protein